MQYQHFGNTSMLVSKISLGAMTFSYKRLADPTLCRQILDEALDQGVNMIDTAECYGGGESERILGKILGKKRDQVFVTTKAAGMYTEQRCGPHSRTNLRASVDGSIARLQTDCIDVLLLHAIFDEQTPALETMSALDELIKDGKIRYIGASNCCAWQLSHFNHVAERHHLTPFTVAQLNYNILDRHSDIELNGFCEKFNIPVMAYSPLCGGLLTGKLKRGEAPDPDSRLGSLHTRNKIPDIVDNDHVHNILDELRTIADDLGVELNQLAMLWIMAKPFIGTVIAGGSCPEHFSANYKISDDQLPMDIVQRIDDLSQAQIYRPPRVMPVPEAPPLRMA